MPRSPGRTGSAWRKTRTLVLANATHCAICHLPLDPDAPARTRWSSSVDHITKLEHGGEPLSLDNLRAVHYGCNSTRENRQRRHTTRRTSLSRAW